MDEIFLEEWKLYRRGVERPRLCGELPRGEAAFDPSVRPGDIRVFADTNVPLTALVVDDCGLSGRRIVPVSPFGVPASSREIKLGGRVFQLWNATVVSRRLSDRSWLVERVPEALLEAVRGRIAASAPGRITAGDGVLARYEREFLLTGGGLVPLFRTRASQPRAFSLGISGWGLAASLALIAGLGAAMAIWRGNPARDAQYAYDVEFPQAYETVELIEAKDPADEPLRTCDVVVDFPLDAGAPPFPVPPKEEPAIRWLAFPFARMAAAMAKIPDLFRSSHIGETYERADGGEAMATAQDGSGKQGPQVLATAKAKKDDERAASTNVTFGVRKSFVPSEQPDDVRVDVEL